MNGRNGHGRHYGEALMNELTQETQRGRTDDGLAALDYDDSGLILSDISRSIAEVARIGPSRPRRVRIALGSASVEVEWNGGPEDQQAPAVRTEGAAGTVAAAVEAARSGAVDIVEGHRECAPLVGTFYSAPAPGARPFVQIGDRVEKGQQLGIIEAMKLMNPLEAARPGRVVEVLVGDGESVEYGEPLVLIDPDEPSGADEEA